MSERAPRWYAVDLVVAVAAFWAAARVRVGALVGMEMPPDGATLFHRSLDLRDGVDLPLLGNTVVGWPFHFGVFPDWYRSLWMLGTDSLHEAARQVASSHALVAAWAYLLCARLGARGAGLLLAATLAIDPQIVSFAFAYPIDYRTAEWGLLLALAMVLVAARHPDRSPGGTVALVLASSLLVTTHPFAAAALLPAGIALLRWGTWPGARLAAVATGGALLVAGPWLLDLVRGLGPFFGQSFDAAGRTTAPAFPTEILGAWWGSLADVVGGPLTPGVPADVVSPWLLPAVLLLGLVGALAVPRSRPLLLLWLGWFGALLALVAVAGFVPKRYHVIPPMTVGLAAAVVGLELGLAALLGRWPRARPHAGRLAGVALAVVTAVMVLGPFGARLRQIAEASAGSPPSVALEADHLAAVARGLLDGEDGLWIYAFHELRHQGLADGVPVAMRLQTGAVDAGRVAEGRPVVAFLSRRGHLDLPAFRVEKVVLVSKGEWVHVGRLPSLDAWPAACRALDATEPEPLGVAGVQANAAVGVACP